MTFSSKIKNKNIIQSILTVLLVIGILVGSMFTEYAFYEFTTEKNQPIGLECRTNFP